VGVRFSTPVETGPEAHPVSCTMGTGDVFQVKPPGSGIDHTPPSRAEVKERVGRGIHLSTLYNGKVTQIFVSI
jgi:hypothetical protein